MKGDIALAGYLLTAEEWQSLDPRSRALLITAAARPRGDDDAWMVSGPIAVSDELDGDHRSER